MAAGRFSSLDISNALDRIRIFGATSTLRTQLYSANEPAQSIEADVQDFCNCLATQKKPFWDLVAPTFPLLRGQAVSSSPPERSLPALDAIRAAAGSLIPSPDPSIVSQIERRVIKELLDELSAVILDKSLDDKDVCVLMARVLESMHEKFNWSMPEGLRELAGHITRGRGTGTGGGTGGGGGSA